MFLLSQRIALTSLLKYPSRVFLYRTANFHSQHMTESVYNFVKNWAKTDFFASLPLLLPCIFSSPSAHPTCQFQQNQVYLEAMKVCRYLKVRISKDSIRQLSNNNRLRNRYMNASCTVIGKVFRWPKVFIRKLLAPLSFPASITNTVTVQSVQYMLQLLKFSSKLNFRRIYLIYFFTPECCFKCCVLFFQQKEDCWSRRY